ncbi:Daunorubicin/doxorubicin resistance ATP-binding protein DrrA [Solibacillus isronensis B3W22]|uniref:Daunorubicin/doxorubicin resistance ATP-binding protein DrrA n=1 Tax=Solibacillus isronensis B3W22 TaxID=1224748 RepID=K1L7R2_9BACL|nr:ATP-binding cassette domain-containing protein [Solibacillus isronensis]AMO85889.1 ABC transporter [Solibacillus silvestris]EKB46553.1 Daunorubicin/doxorubicin resistance ATP-binding protein DrrA [Solibacillus isronensis B3W22]
MQVLIDVQQLTKRYGEVEAVKGISFSVQKGALFAFLGSNGAGKSTTIEMLCTLLEKTSGTVSIDGHTLGNLKGNEAIRRTIGIVFQESILDHQLTVKENILHRGRFYRLPKSMLQENYDFVQQYLQLADIEHQKYGSLSGGQRRRADIARAIIHKPKLLFLDEPATGLDPFTRQFVWATIDRLRKEVGMTIFLTTHYMEEAANADDIVIMKNGEIIAQGTPNKLKALYAKDFLQFVLKPSIAIEDVTAILPMLLPEKHQDGWKVEVSSTISTIPILAQLEPYIASFEVIKGSLDQVFIETNESREEK